MCLNLFLVSNTFYISKILTLFSRLLPLSGARRPHLDRFYVECIQKARLYTDRTFHSLFSLQRLATWDLGPIPSPETLAHEITTRRRKLLSLFMYTFILYIFSKEN